MDQYSWGSSVGQRGSVTNTASQEKKSSPPTHVFQVPISFPFCSPQIIKDHLEEPMKSHSTFGLFTAIFSPLSNRGEAPTFQCLIHSLQSFSKVSQGSGDGGTFICPEAASAPLPLSLNFFPKPAALGHQYKPRAVHSVHTKVKE